MPRRFDSPATLAGPHANFWPAAEDLLELQRLLYQSQFDFGHLAELIERYPSLSNYFMRRVNSIDQGYGRRIGTLRHALTLLGSQAVADVLQAMRLEMSQKSA